ncbi:MAG TPA: HAD family hydrolase [Pyrinomonadaceae bacterium]|nr:HAD family hydrolase [Pyrinomonadaceae bacterium]
MNTDNPKSKAVFLDRDGTICEDVNYLSRPEDLKPFPFAAEALRLLIENGFLAILITNQSGIARGFFDELALREIHEKLVSELAKQNAKLDAIYFCPHNFGDDCACRKPKTGMIEQASGDFSIDLEKSWMIGDKAIDVETGFRAGTKTALVLTGYGQKDFEKCERKPDFVAENLFLAVKKIIGKTEVRNKK